MNTFAEAMIPIFAIIFTFGIPGIIIFWYLYVRHRERMRLIEKGLPPEEVKAYFQSQSTPKDRPRNSYGSLKFGILCTFVGLGIVIANILYEVYDLDDGFMPGIIIFFGGLGFLIYYLIVNSKLKAQQRSQSDITKQINP